MRGREKMANEDIVVFLEAPDNCVSVIRGDGSEKKTLFTTGCVCPDGVVLDLNTYIKSKNPSDVVLWWGNMGAMKACPGQRDGGDWHDADGFLVCAPLFGGNATVERVEVRAPQHLVLGTAAVHIPKDLPLITTVKQMALARNGRALFFCDREGHAVNKYNVDTKEVVRLLSADALAALADDVEEEKICALPVMPNSIEDQCRFCVGVALDERHNQIFFSIKGPSKGGRGRILAASYDFESRNLHSLEAAKTSLGEGVIDPKAVVTLLDHLPEPIDLLLDTEESCLYWTDRGDAAVGGNSLNRAHLTYNSRTGKPRLREKEMLISGFNEAIGLAWAASLEDRMSLPKDNKDSLRHYMYVTDCGHLWRCDLRARTKEVIYRSGPRCAVTGVVVMRFD